MGVWQGVAGATATGGGKTAKIQRFNANCGRHVGSRAIGTVTFFRDGEELDADINLMGADPNTGYEVLLYMATNDGCNFVTDMGPIATNGAGQGSGEYSAGVDNKKHNYFVDISSGCPDGAATTAPKVCTPNRQGGESSPEDNDSVFIRT